MKTASIRKLTLLLAVASTIVSPGILRADWGDDNPTGVAGWFNGQVQSGCSYDPLTGSAARSITDILVPNAVGTYPLAFTRTMNSRVGTPVGVNYPFGKAGAWRHNYQWEIRNEIFISYDPCEPQPSANSYVVTYPDGRRVTFVPDGSNPYRSSTPGIGDRFDPIRLEEDGSYRCYLLLRDGGRVRFKATVFPDPPPLCANYTSYTYSVAFTGVGIIDPYGQETTITRTPGGLIDTIREPAGRLLKLTYGQYNNGTVISSVQEYLTAAQPGRSIVYSYSTFGTYTSLASVSYFGDTTLTAHYTYQASNAPGTNPPLIKTCDDPMYPGAMSKIAYVFAPGLPHGFLLSENYFDGAVGPAVSTLAVSGNTRIETRGDGPSRTFTYAGGFLKRWTDFKNPAVSSSQEHYTSGGASGFVSYVIDARVNRTDFARNSITGNVTQITYPLTPPDSSQATRIIEYNPGSNPYYVMSVTNERQKLTTYTRDQDSHQVTEIHYPDSAHESFHYNPFGQVTWHQRKNGAYENFDYDPRGLLIHRWNPMTGANAPEVSWPRTVFTYYPLGHPWQDRVQSVKDPRGNITTFEYDRLDTGQMYAGRGLVSRITHPDNKYLSFGYDARGNKLWQENELRQRTSYTYDDYNRVIAVTTPLPNNQTATTIFAYNPTYHPNAPSLSPYLHTTRTVTRITTPAGIITTRRYDENFRRTETTQGAETQVAATTHFGYDEAGNLKSVIDPRNKETTIDYDQRNRRRKVTGPPLSDYGNIQYVTQWFYDPASNVRKILLPDLTEINRNYDEMNRLLTNDLTSSNQLQHRVTTYTYYPSGQIHTLRDPKEQMTTFEYDERDLKTKMIYPDQTFLQGWQYDENGNMTERPTIGGPKQLFAYDNRNRLWHMRWNNGIDFSDFGYDDASRLTSAVNPYSNITREYDAGGRLKLDRQVLATAFNTAAITLTPLGVVSRKTHGPAGSFDINLPLTGTPGIECRNGPSYTLVLTFAHPVTVGGATVTSGIGSVLSVTASGNVVAVNLTGVSNAQLVTVKVFGLSDGTNTGELTIPMHVLIGDTTADGVVNSDDSLQTNDREEQLTGASNFRSDVNTDGVINADDVSKVTLTAGFDVPTPPAPGPQVEVSYIYDDDGKVTRLSVPAYSFNYAYDGMGRLEWIKRTDNPDEIRYQYSYDASSNVIGRTSYTNNTSLSFLRDEVNRITEETILHGSDVLSHLHYRYDRMSRLISTLRDEDGLLDGFDYNFTGELVFPQYGLHSDGHGGFDNPENVGSYVYDNAGNRLSVNGVTYTPNSLNQYTVAQGTAVGNGSQHEINSYQEVNYSYLADTRLAAVQSNANGLYQLGYDALGRTVRRTTNGQTTYFIYDGARSIIEYNASGTMTSNTLYGMGVDEIIARYNNGVGQFLLQDRLGSTVAVTGSKGQLLEKYRYDAFGTPKIIDPDGTVLTDTAINNRILFAGREWVSRFGFYENRARAYHPGLGRFMSEDPLGFSGGDTNLFRYCGNDPVNWVDPSGLILVTARYLNEHKGGGFGSNGLGILGGGGDVSARGGERGFYQGYELPNGDFVDTIPADAANNIVRAPPIGGSFYPPGMFPPGYSPGPVSFSFGGGGPHWDPLGELMDVYRILVTPAGGLLTVFQNGVTITENGGLGEGVQQQLTLNPAGITYRIGFGPGVGAGLSVTSAVVQSGQVTGPNVQGSLSGGYFFGGTFSGTIGPGPTAYRGGVGFGIGFGTTVTYGQTVFVPWPWNDDHD